MLQKINICLCFITEDNHFVMVHIADKCSSSLRVSEAYASSLWTKQGPVTLLLSLKSQKPDRLKKIDNRLCFIIAYATTLRAS